VRNKATIGNLDTDDNRANSDVTTRADHRVMNDRIEANKGVITDVRWSVDQGVVRDRDIFADVDRPLLTRDLHILLFERVQNHSVLDVGVRSDEKR
jgi:hypothetical protein